MALSVQVTGTHIIETPTTNLLGTAKVSISSGDFIFFVRIMNGRNGPFVAYPSIWNKSKNEGVGGFENAFFLSDELRNDVGTCVLAEFENKKKSAPSSSGTSTPHKKETVKENKNPVPASEVEDNFDDDIPF